VAADVESARRDWAEGYRRLQTDTSGPSAALDAQVAAITEELRRRVGGIYTTAELAGAYRDSERWAREAVAETSPMQGWERTLTVATDAAFHVYARGAVDYEP
jgi:NAD(P)-dependent dehydrogenase (short-subunit alcohol dehydrogenase family)